MQLAPGKEQFCIAIAEGALKKDAAALVGKTPITATRWLQEPEVQNRIKELLANASEQAMTFLKQKLMTNIEVIQGIAERGGVPGVVPSQLKAAMWAVDKVIRLAAADDQPSEEDRALATMGDEDIDDLLERGQATSTPTEGSPSPI
jgi:hypothetical protein